MSVYAPILFFAFNRPTHTKQSLESLILNPECKQSSLLAFVDGPRDSEEAERVQSVVRIIQSYKHYFKSFHLIHNEYNLGCDTQIISNLKTFCKTHERFIYLEDDCSVSPFFLKFMNEGLQKYNDHHQVKTIAGYIPYLPHKPTSCFFLSSFATWGFASWARVINDYIYDPRKIYTQLKQQNLLNKFSFNHTTHSIQCMKKKISDPSVASFDSFFRAYLLLKNGLTLFPNQSLVKNIGTDGSGTNFLYSTKKYATHLAKEPITHFPDKIEESQEMYNAYVNFFKSYRLGFWGHVKSKTKKILSLFRKQHLLL